MSKTPEKHSSSPRETRNGHYAFYVVWIGKKPGIYSSWRACQEQVVGFKNASFKGYYTYNDAMDAFQNKEDHPVFTLHDKAFEDSSLERCPNCELLSLRIKVLEAQLAYHSEKNATPSPSKEQSVPHILAELSEMLQEKTVFKDGSSGGGKM